MRLLEDYKEKRKKFRDLHSRILNSVSSSYGYKAAEVMGILENKRIVFESYPERDAHLDFTVYGEIEDGNSALSNYLNDHDAKNEEEEEFLKIMEQSVVSFYEITGVDPENNTIMLADILNPSHVYKVIDVALSGSAKEKTLICTRLFHLGSYSMTSGLLFLFSPDHREYILRRSRKMMKKMKGANKSDKRFLAFFDLNRRDGLPAMLEDVK